MMSHLTCILVVSNEEDVGCIARGVALMSAGPRLDNLLNIVYIDFVFTLSKRPVHLSNAPVFTVSKYSIVL